MKLGILQAGRLSPPLDAFGDYSDMFRALFARAAPEIDVRKYEVTLGQLPGHPRECDVWLISGSAHGVHDGFDWLTQLEAFVRELHAGAHKTIGVCFGHQLIAKVCGGQVERAKSGWCAGVTRYSGRPDVDVAGVDADVADDDDTWLIASHQDQVVRMPAGARLELTSNVCPIAGFSLGQHMITVQAHPEFRPDFARALFEVRRETLGAERYEAAVNSLGRSTTDLGLTKRLLAFLRD